LGERERPVLRPGWDAEFTEFAAARMTALRRVAYLLCQDWHRADDLVQVAMTRLYANWPRASVMDHPEAYVRMILVREYISERRSGWARRVSLDGGVPEWACAQPDRDAMLDMTAALAGLPPRQRATIVLRFYCDLTVDQAADVLGCTPGTVKSQTAKGLRALRLSLEPSESNGSDAGGRQRERVVGNGKERGNG
jgi:RNA polymerase sigma-70 factor (sigma-E family)